MALTVEERLAAVEKALHLLPEDGSCPAYMREDRKRQAKDADAMRPLLQLWQAAHCLPGALVYPGVPEVEQWAAEEIERLQAVLAQTDRGQ